MHQRLFTMKAVSLVSFTILMVQAASPVEESRQARGLKRDDSSSNPTRHSLTTYDQRQNGKYNIHVNIKDVKIISVDGDHLEGDLGDDVVYDYGDYDYDPSHLTINPLPIFGVSTSKPPKTTTKAPVSITSSKPTTTTATTYTTTSVATVSPTAASAEFTNATTSTTTDATQSTTKIPVKIHLSSEGTNPTHAAVATATTTLQSSNIFVIKPTPPSIHYDYQEIPVEVIVEPILRPKYRNHQPLVVSAPAATASRRKFVKKNSVEILRDHGLGPGDVRSCDEGKYRDRDGKCRARRSGILKLFRLLSTLKEKND